MRTTRLGGCIATSLLTALLVVGGAFAEQAKPAASTSAQLVNLELKDISVRDAIGRIFEGTGHKYKLQPEVSGKVVELTLKGVTFEQALDAMMEAARLTYRIEDGIYVIGAAKSATGGAAAAAGSGVTQPARAQSEAQTQPPPADQSPVPEPQAPAVSTPASGVGPVVINNEQNSPVFYGLPAPGQFYSLYGFGGYPPAYQVGAVSILGGYPPVVVAGGTPYIIRHEPMVPPPPGYVSPDIQRFLQTQWAIRSRTFITPY